jgi:ADP-glucose pyrophosphorylase
MGIYVIAPDLLEKLLIEDAADRQVASTTSARTSFRRRSTAAVFAYPFQTSKTRAQNYWRDVGNVDAFYEANMELVRSIPSSTSTTISGRSGPIRPSSRRRSSCSTRRAGAAWRSIPWSPAAASSPAPT